jgi:hypothetical protein
MPARKMENCSIISGLYKMCFILPQKRKNKRVLFAVLDEKLVNVYSCLPAVISKCTKFAQLGNRLTANDIALLNFANLKLSQSSHLLDLNL